MYFPNFFFIFAKIKIILPMIYKLQNGGIVKLQNAGSIPQSQNKIMKLWHTAYDSKLGEAVRNFMFGKDYNLSNEEYIQKHGFSRLKELAIPWFTQVSGPGIIMNLNKLGKVNITLEPEKYWYVAHQTASEHLPSIMKEGLRTGQGLRGTALPLTEDYLKSFAEGTLKQQNLLHKGSDALVVAKFPKSKFPSGDLDDISFKLMELGESKNFEVPSQYLRGFIKDQLKQGGILKAQNGIPSFVTPMTNQFTTKLMEFLEKYRRKGPAPQKAVGPAVWAYNKPSKIADDGGKIS